MTATFQTSVLLPFFLTVWGGRRTPHVVRACELFCEAVKHAQPWVEVWHVELQTPTGKYVLSGQPTN